MGAGTDQLWPPSAGSLVLTAEERWACTTCSFMQVPEVPRERGQTARVGAGGLILPL